MSVDVSEMVSEWIRAPSVAEDGSSYDTIVTCMTIDVSLGHTGGLASDVLAIVRVDDVIPSVTGLVTFTTTADGVIQTHADTCGGTTSLRFERQFDGASYTPTLIFSLLRPYDVKAGTTETHRHAFRSIGDMIEDALRLDRTRQCMEGTCKVGVSMVIEIHSPDPYTV